MAARGLASCPSALPTGAVLGDGGEMDSTAGQTQVIETHLSRLLLTPDRVYKLAKPVTTSFVDLAGTDDRLAAAVFCLRWRQ